MCYNEKDITTAINKGSVVQEINLYDLLRYYAKNWLNLLGALFIGAIIGVAYTGIIQTPLYKSQSTMIIVSTNKTASEKASNINNNYAELFKSRLVLETVVREKGYTGSYEQLLSRTTATTDADTDILRVSIADPDPKTSQALLFASVKTFKDQAKGIYTNAENIKTVDTASLPSSAYNVKAPMQIGLSMAAVFFAAVIALFFVYDYKNSNPARTKATQKQNKKTAQAPATNGGDVAKTATTSKRTKNVNNSKKTTSITTEAPAPKQRKKNNTRNTKAASKK